MKTKIQAKEEWKQENGLYKCPRHDYFESIGWKIIEIPFFCVFKKKEMMQIISEAVNGNIVFSEEISQKIIDYRVKRRELAESTSRRHLLRAPRTIGPGRRVARRWTRMASSPASWGIVSPARRGVTYAASNARHGATSPVVNTARVTTGADLRRQSPRYR